MPELPEVEALRRSLDDPVRAFPIEQAGPAHIATLKTFDPPLAVLEGRRLVGAERRAKRLLFPTEDGELVLLVHLMSAGRIRYLRAGEAGPKTAAFRVRFQGGGQLVLTEAGAKKRAGVWLLTPEQVDLELCHLGPEALGLGEERLGEILATEQRRLHSLLRDQRVIAGIGRAWANEILHTAGLSPFATAQGLTPGQVETLAEAGFRAKVGVTVIAILREPEPVSGARPDDVIQQGDTLVTVGKAKQYAPFRRMLEGETPA